MAKQKWSNKKLRTFTVNHLSMPRRESLDSEPNMEMPKKRKKNKFKFSKNVAASKALNETYLTLPTSARKITMNRSRQISLRLFFVGRRSMSFVVFSFANWKMFNRTATKREMVSVDKPTSKCVRARSVINRNALLLMWRKKRKWTESSVRRWLCAGNNNRRKKKNKTNNCSYPEFMTTQYVRCVAKFALIQWQKRKKKFKRKKKKQNTTFDEKLLHVRKTEPKRSMHETALVYTSFATKHRIRSRATEIPPNTPYNTVASLTRI